MRKTWGIIALFALILGALCGGVPAAASSEGAPPIEQTVELQVTVEKWAKMSALESMELDLAQPGTRRETSQKITVATNTKVRVTVSDPTLSLIEEDAAALGFKAADDLPLKYGVGFRGPNTSSMNGVKEYEVEAGTEDTRELVFWAEWLDSDNWYRLVAGKYKGSVTVTVAAIN